MRHTWLRWLAALFLLCVLAVSSAQAQLFNRRTEPEPDHEVHRLLAVPYAVGLVGVLAVLVIICMPSRKHT